MLSYISSTLEVERRAR